MRSIFAFVLWGLASSFMPGDTSIGEARAIIMKINATYEKMSNYSMVCRYTIFEDSYNGAVNDRQDLVFKKFSKNKYCSEVNATESIYFEGLLLLIDRTNKKMLLQQRVEASPALSEMELFSQLKEAKSVSVSNSKITLEYSDPLIPYSKVSMCYTEGYQVKELVLYPRQKIEVYDNAGKAEMKTAVVKIEFLDLKENTVKESEVSIYNYIKKKGSNYELNSAFKSYQLIQ